MTQQNEHTHKRLSSGRSIYKKTGVVNNKRVQILTNLWVVEKQSSLSLSLPPHYSPMLQFLGTNDSICKNNETGHETIHGKQCFNCKISFIKGAKGSTCRTDQPLSPLSQRIKHHYLLAIFYRFLFLISLLFHFHLENSFSLP